jgi:hypothetical protein
MLLLIHRGLTASNLGFLFAGPRPSSTLFLFLSRVLSVSLQIRSVILPYPSDNGSTGSGPHSWRPVSSSQVEEHHVLESACNKEIFIKPTALNAALHHFLIEIHLMRVGGLVEARTAGNVPYRYPGSSDWKKTTSFSRSLKMLMQFLKYINNPSLLARTRSPSMW